MEHGVPHGTGVEQTVSRRGGAWNEWFLTGGVCVKRAILRRGGTQANACAQKGRAQRVRIDE